MKRLRGPSVPKTKPKPKYIDWSFEGLDFLSQPELDYDDQVIKAMADEIDRTIMDSLRKYK